MYRRDKAFFKRGLNVMITCFDEATIKGDEIIILGQSYDIVKGKHSIWIPSMEAKITWSYKGEITSLLKEEYKGKILSWNAENLQSIMNERIIMKELSKVNFAPPIGDVLYIKHMISDIFGNDKQGVYGYYMKDADKISRGKYSFKKFVELFFDKISLSDWTTRKTNVKKGIYGAALGDLQKNNNIVNGYIVDVRRTRWDMIEWKDLNKYAYKELIINDE